MISLVRCKLCVCVINFVRHGIISSVVCWPELLAVAVQQWTLNVRSMLHSLARGCAAARRVGDVPQLPRRDLQDVGVAQPRRREDRLGVAQRVQVLHPRLPPPLAAAPRRANLRGEVSGRRWNANGDLRVLLSYRVEATAAARGIPVSRVESTTHRPRNLFSQGVQVQSNGGGRVVAVAKIAARRLGSHCVRRVPEAGGGAAPRVAGRAARGPQAAPAAQVRRRRGPPRPRGPPAAPTDRAASQADGLPVRGHRLRLARAGARGARARGAVRAPAALGRRRRARAGRARRAARPRQRRLHAALRALLLREDHHQR